MEKGLQEFVEGLEAEDAGELKTISYDSLEIMSQPWDDMLAEVLTPEQQQSYAALQDERRQDRIEARALRQLAGLQTSLDMSPEQRDQIFDVFHAQAVERGENPPTVKEQYQTFMAEGGTATGWSEHHQQTRQSEREAQLDSVREILNERQLDAYRDILESGQSNRAKVVTRFIEVSQPN